MNANKHRNLPVVAIDARMVSEVGHGIARYVTLMARGLALANTESPLPYEPVFLVQPGFEGLKIWSGFRTLAVNAPFLHPSEWWVVPGELKKMAADLYHSPSFSSLPWSPCPWMMTVHDLNHLTFGNLGQKAYYQFLLKSFAKKSKALLTVSEFSKREISLWTHLPEDQIEVVYNAIEEGFGAHADPKTSKKVLEKFGLEAGQYFFCLSHFKPHKNLDFLIHAFDRFQKTYPELSVKWKLAVSADAPRTVTHVTMTGPLEDQEAEILLRHAGAMVFPSLYEGFGRPPLEAALLGIPLLVSKIPPLEEALQDMKAGEVLYAEPTDEKAWVEGLKAVIEGKIQGASSETQAHIRDRFSVKRLGIHMDQIYRRVLGLSS